MRTLRGRLVLSHVLPFLLTIPLVAVALIYALETQVILAGVSDQLAGYAALGADMMDDRPGVWHDPGEARQFAQWIGSYSQSHVMLFDGDGRLLATNDLAYTGRLGQAMYMPNLQAALDGERQVGASYALTLRTEVVRVLVPVVGPGAEVLGVVRLSRYLADVQAQMGHLRRLTIAILAAELLLATGLGLILALNLGRSLQRVTNAVSALSWERTWKTLPEEGPTEIRTLLRAFNSLTQRLQTLEESRRRLLANLVHELARPLGAVQSALQALLGGADEQPALRRELLEGMSAQVLRLRPLLDSLTDLHGQVLGTLTLNRQPVDLQEWLAPTSAPWRQAALDKGLEWHTDVPDSLPVIEVDPDRLAQVLGNLLSNAIKFTSSGTVSLEAGVQEGGIAIVVGDTGPGIAADEQQAIFQPFYRSQRERRFPQGMGLGLSIARDLVQAHGGWLQVDSAPHQGSRFTVWLPIQADVRSDRP